MSDDESLRFGTRDRPPEFHALLEALERLDRVDASLPCYAYASYAAWRRKQVYLDHYKLRPSKSRCAGILLGKTCRRNRPDGCFDFHSPGEVDHVSVWRSDELRNRYIHQPYGLNWEQVCETVDFCRKHNLEAHVSASASWHFPGETLLVELTEKTQNRHRILPIRFAEQEKFHRGNGKRTIGGVGLLRIHKDGDRMSIVTEAQGEDEFSDSFTSALHDMIEKGEFTGDWKFQLDHLLPMYADICCKYRGYKVDGIRERRVLIAGNNMPPESTIYSTVSERGEVVTAGGEAIENS